MMAIGGFLIVEALTYVGLFTSWDTLGDELGVTLWTGLAFSLFSTFFFVRKPRHSQAQDLAAVADLAMPHRQSSSATTRSWKSGAGQSLSWAQSAAAMRKCARRWVGPSGDGPRLCDYRRWTVARPNERWRGWGETELRWR